MPFVFVPPPRGTIESGVGDPEGPPATAGDGAIASCPCALIATSCGLIASRGNPGAPGACAAPPDGGGTAATPDGGGTAGDPDGGGTAGDPDGGGTAGDNAVPGEAGELRPRPVVSDSGVGTGTTAAGTPISFAIRASIIPIVFGSSAANATPGGASAAPASPGVACTMLGPGLCGTPPASPRSPS